MKLFQKAFGAAKTVASVTTDGFSNVVARIGTDRDRSYHSTYTDPIENTQENTAAFRTSAIARRIIKLPAEDACREWREWQTEKDLISKLEAEEKRLDVQGKVLEARWKARLFGSAFIIIGTGETNTRRPLNVDRISRHGLKYLTVLTSHELTANEIEQDPRLPEYGGPKMYSVTAGSSAGMLEIHPSRVVVFHGVQRPETGVIKDYLGDFVLTSALTSVKRMDEAHGNIGTLLFEAKVDVFGIPDLTSNLRSMGQAYEDQVVARVELAAKSKGINGMLIRDAEETYDQKQVNFGTLPEIFDRFMQMVSASSGIPQTLLFGTSPGGMNSTGESDVRGYYDRVKVEQTLEMEPAMAVLDECVIRSALNDRPDDVHYNWRPLWQPSRKDIAEIPSSAISRIAKLYGPEADDFRYCIRAMDDAWLKIANPPKEGPNRA